jgi:hypothetical protein
VTHTHTHIHTHTHRQSTLGKYMVNIRAGVVDPDPVASASYCRIRIHNFPFGEIASVIERPDQGHLYPLGEPRDTCHSQGANLRPPAPQARTLPNELCRQLICWLFGTSTWPGGGRYIRPPQYKKVKQPPPPLFPDSVSASGIRDLGSGMKKIRIREKLAGSAPLVCIFIYRRVD